MSMHERMETIRSNASYPVTALRTASCGLYFCTISTNWSKSSYISALDMVVWAGRERENDNARIKSNVCFMAAALKLYKLIFITTLLQPELLRGEGAIAPFSAGFGRKWRVQLLILTKASFHPCSPKYSFAVLQFYSILSVAQTAACLH